MIGRDHAAALSMLAAGLRQGSGNRPGSHPKFPPEPFSLAGVVHKAEGAGGIGAKVNQRGTSQECDRCGRVTPKTLADPHPQLPRLRDG